MRTFLVVAAVLIGLANAALYVGLDEDSIDDVFARWEPDPWPVTALYALSAVLVGLLISGGLLRLAGRDLHGSFFARYGLMVLAICVGGAVLSGLLTTITTLFDEQAMMPSQPPEVFYTIAFTALPGGILGAVDGVILAFPLAGLLGLFREPG